MPYEGRHLTSILGVPENTTFIAKTENTSRTTTKNTIHKTQIKSILILEQTIAQENGYHNNFISKWGQWIQWINTVENTDPK